MTVFEFTIDPNRSSLIRRALSKRILRQREIEEEEASTEEDESFLGRPIARRKQSSSRQGSQGIRDDDAEQTNTTAISVTVTQPNGATTTASRAAAKTVATTTGARRADGPKGSSGGDDESGQESSKDGTTTVSMASPSHSTSSLGDGMKHKSRWKSEYLRATSESSQPDRGSSPIDPVAEEGVRGEGMEGEEGNKNAGGGGGGGDEGSAQQDAQQQPLDTSATAAPDAAGFPNTMPGGGREGGGGDSTTEEGSIPRPDPIEQAILARLDELRKEKTRLFQQFKEANARKSAMKTAAPAAVAATTTAQPQAPPAMPLEGATTSNPDTMNTAIKDDIVARRLSRSEVEVSFPSDQKIDKNVQESRKKLEVEIPRDRHSPGAEVPPSLSSATSTASSATPYSPVNSHSSHLPSDRDRTYQQSSSPSTTASTTPLSSPQFVSPGKGGAGGIKRPRSDSPPPLSALSHEGGAGGPGGGMGPGPRRRPRHFDDRPPRAPTGHGGGGGSVDMTVRKPLPTYPGLPSKPQIRQPYSGGGGGGGGKFGEPGRDRGRGPFGGSSNIANSNSGGGNINSMGPGLGGTGGSNMEGKHALPRRPFVDESRNRGGGGGGGGVGPSGANGGSSGSMNAGGSGGAAGGGRSGGGGGPYARGGGGGGGGGSGGGGGHSSLPDRPLLDYRPVIGGPQGRPLPFSRSMMQMPRPGGFLPGRPPTLMRPVWPRRGSRS